jgi:ABC-type iron transport system FetAB permease component
MVESKKSILRRLVLDIVLDIVLVENHPTLVFVCILFFLLKALVLESFRSLDFARAVLVSEDWVLQFTS